MYPDCLNDLFICITWIFDQESLYLIELTIQTQASNTHVLDTHVIPTHLNETTINQITTLLRNKPQRHAIPIHLQAHLPCHGRPSRANDDAINDAHNNPYTDTDTVLLLLLLMIITIITMIVTILIMIMILNIKQQLIMILLLLLLLLIIILIILTIINKTLISSSFLDSLRGSSVKVGTIQRRLAWPLRKDDTHKSRSVNNNQLIFPVTVDLLEQHPDSLTPFCQEVYRSA